MLINALLFLLPFASSYFLSPLSTEEFEIDYGEGVCKVKRCKTLSLCSSHSTCDENTGICKCDKGYASKGDDGVVFCCYAQKAKYKAFVYEFLLGFGIGHKYIGNDHIFYIKFFVYVFFVISSIGFCVLSFFFKNDEISFSMKFTRTLFFLLCGCTFICWQIIDGVMIMLDGYKDENGVELANMF